MRNQVPRRYVKGDGYEAAALPYQALAGHHFEMIAVLPESALSELEPAMDAAWLETLLAGMRTTDVALSLPRFAFRSPLKLRATLSALGMPTPFEPGKGDFSGIAPAVPPLHLLDVVHEAFIDVNELGTVAGAATAVIVGKDGGISVVPPVELRFDRPFFLLLRHVESGSVVFMGRVTAP
jgi:serpin B